MNTFLNDQVYSPDFDYLIELEKLETENFCEVSNFLGLDPATDFQNADLRGVDFSNCDLSNFVFKGSDLSCSFGINIRMPPKEHLEKAFLDNSVFSTYFNTERYLNENPILNADITKRSNSDALSLSEWVLKLSADKEHSEEELVAITTKLFSETKFHSVKNSVLYGSMRFLAKQDFKKFLFHLFATEMEDEETIRITLQMLSRIFPNDDEAINYPLAIIRSEQRLELLDTAISSVAKSKHFRKLRPLVRSIIYSNSRSEFRQFIMRKSVGSSTDSSWPLLYDINFPPFTTNVDSVTFLDFANTITEEVALALAWRAARIESVREKNLLSQNRRSSNLEEMYKELVQKKPTSKMTTLGAFRMKNAFQKFYKQTGVKFYFDEKACEILSPRREIYATSNQSDDIAAQTHENRAGWITAVDFL